MTGTGALQKATFAAGSFWPVEAAFRRLTGVHQTKAGYTGGRVDNPSYEMVCTGNTEHAEAVEVLFDSAEISYAELLRVFWSIHDPTSRNRQGADVGSQYRSAIFVHSSDQEREAQASCQAENKSGRHRKPVVTGIHQATTFWPAEDYHQQFLDKCGAV